MSRQLSLKQLAQEGKLTQQVRNKVRACKLEESPESPNSPYWSNEEWHEYGVHAMKNFNMLLNKEIKPSWDLVRFRSEKDFVYGSFNNNTDLWLPLVQCMPEDIRGQIYHILTRGVNLYDNLANVSIYAPVEYKKFKVATYFIENPDNTVALANRLKDETGKNLEERATSGDYEYPRVVKYPIFARGPNFGKPFRLENSRSISKNNDEVVKQIMKWIQSGAVTHIPDKTSVKPLMHSNMVVVPKADGDIRICYNGGPLKQIERFSQPCHLDSCADVLHFIRKGDLLAKMEDKQMFFHMNLDNFSRELAYFSYDDQLFRYNAGAFGLPKSQK